MNAKLVLLLPLLSLLVLANSTPAIHAQDGALFDLGDASGSTFPTLLNDLGPAVLALNDDGSFASPIILGECVSAEADANQGDPGDDCDDAGPGFNRLDDDAFRALIRRTGVTGETDFFLNALIDLNNDGLWNPETEWVVRNCPVPAVGVERELINCPAEPVDFLSVESGWGRILLSDVPAPSGGWDGSAFFAPGAARGEVEDYLFFTIFDFGDAPGNLYPTFPANAAPGGPFVPIHRPEVGLGVCTTWEAIPNEQIGDDCDDGRPTFDINNQTFTVDVSAGSNFAERPLYINVVFDLDDTPGWLAQQEWVVRNCPVPSDAQTGSLTAVTCSMTFPPSAVDNLPTDTLLWYRVLLSDFAFDQAAGWDGSIQPDTLSVGEVEDYAVIVDSSGGPPGYGGGGPGTPSGGPGASGITDSDAGEDTTGPFIILGSGGPLDDQAQGPSVVVPGPSPTPTPPSEPAQEGNATSSDTVAILATYFDEQSDAVRCDTGELSADPEVDIVSVTLSQTTSNEWVYLQVQLTEPLVTDYSFAVLALLGNPDTASGYLWEIHDTNTRIGPINPSTGQLLDDPDLGVIITHDREIGLVTYTIPRTTLPDVTDTMMVRSFHTPTEATQPQPTGCDIWGPQGLDVPLGQPLTGPFDEDVPPSPTPFETATPVPTCEITALNNLNLRAEPSTASDIVGTLAAGETTLAVGQTVGEDSFVWWYLQSDSYVRDDVVSTGIECNNLPGVP